MITSTSTSIGKARRLARLFDPRTDRTVIAPLDDSLLSGPEGGLRRLGAKVEQVVTGGANAVLGFYGLFAHFPREVGTAGTILNLTASTIRGTHTRKVAIGSVTRALEMDMDAVAVHVNIGSKYEHEMLGVLGAVSQECHLSGMPLLALMYPRSERDRGGDDNFYDLLRTGPDDYAELVRHAVRIGVELGADIVKTPYTGTPDSFATVVESACGVPVVIAGGPETSISHILQMTHGVVQAGGAGIAGGRNAFHRRDAGAVIEALCSVVHEGVSAAEALSVFEQRVLPRGDQILEDDLPRGTTFMTSPKPAWITDDPSDLHARS